MKEVPKRHRGIDDEGVTQLRKKVSKSRTFKNLRNLYDLDQKTVLDVGCSEGHYLVHFGRGSTGVTIIDAHVEEGRRYGLEIVSKNVEDPSFAMEKKYDFVWANNIFEHLNAPHLFLRKMADCLTDDGVLILGVPVIPHAPLIDRLTKFRGAYAVSHVNFFTRKTLIETVRAAGWEVKQARMFYTKFSTLDWFLNFIAPHVYVVAQPKRDFKYAEKRFRSLEGYTS